MTETGREGWTQEERELYDAHADHEAWEHARSIIGPFAQIAREVGSPELLRVMDKALAEVEGEVNRTTGVLDALRA